MATFFKFLIVLIPALVALFTYLLGDKRKLEKLREQIKQKEGEMRNAVAINDTVRISVLERELKQLRAELKRRTAAK